MLKRIWRFLGKGTIFWGIVFVLLALGSPVLGMLKSLRSDVVPNLSPLIVILAIFLLIVATSALFNSRRLKSALLKSERSLVANVVLSFFLENGTGGTIRKEVLFEKACPGDWTIGVVTSEYQSISDPRDPNSPIVTWCVIPITFAGETKVRKKSEVIFTGRTAIETAANLASFCVNMQLDYKKFRKGE